MDFWSWPKNYSPATGYTKKLRVRQFYSLPRPSPIGSSSRPPHSPTAVAVVARLPFLVAAEHKADGHLPPSPRHGRAEPLVRPIPYDHPHHSLVAREVFPTMAACTCRGRHHAHVLLAELVSGRRYAFLAGSGVRACRMKRMKTCGPMCQ